MSSRSRYTSPRSPVRRRRERPLAQRFQVHSAAPAPRRSPPAAARRGAFRTPGPATSADASPKWPRTGGPPRPPRTPRPRGPPRPRRPEGDPAREFPSRGPSPPRARPRARRRLRPRAGRQAKLALRGGQGFERPERVEVDRRDRGKHPDARGGDAAQVLDVSRVGRPHLQDQDLGARVGRQHREGEPDLVVEVSRGRRDPLARVSGDTAASASLVVVLPTLPVMPTTVGAGASWRAAASTGRAAAARPGDPQRRASAPSSGRSWRPSPPRRAGTASGAKSAPSVRPRRAKKGPPPARVASRWRPRAPRRFPRGRQDAGADGPRDLLEGGRPQRSPPSTRVVTAAGQAGR